MYTKDYFKIGSVYFFIIKGFILVYYFYKILFAKNIKETVEENNIQIITTTYIVKINICIKLKYIFQFVFLRR